MIIQGLWIGPKLSRFEHNSIKSYLAQGYEYHLYTYDTVGNVPDGVIIKDASEIIPKSLIFYYEGSITPFSDLFRYKLLYEKGGVWTDCDIICVHRFSAKNDYIFVAERTILKGAFASCMKKPPYTCKKKKVLNSFIAAPAGSPIMKTMYDKSLQYRSKYLAAILKTKKSARRKITSRTSKKNVGLVSYHWPGGSKLLETEIEKHHLTRYITEPEFAFHINWWDFKYAFQNVSQIEPTKGWTKPILVDDIFKKNKGIYLVTIHNGWLKNHHIDKNAHYPENSLFERLDKWIIQSILKRK